jgi:hypothetical protein
MKKLLLTAGIALLGASRMLELGLSGFVLQVPSGIQGRQPSNFWS